MLNLPADTGINRIGNLLGISGLGIINDYTFDCNILLGFRPDGGAGVTIGRTFSISFALDIWIIK